MNKGTPDNRDVFWAIANSPENRELSQLAAASNDPLLKAVTETLLGEEHDPTVVQLCMEWFDNYVANAHEVSLENQHKVFGQCARVLNEEGRLHGYSTRLL
jgi:hypothetical protein